MNNKLRELGIRSVTAVAMAIVFLGVYFSSALAFNAFLFLGLLWILWFEWPKLCPIKGLQGILFTLLYPITPLLTLIYIHTAYRSIDIMLPLYPFLIALTYDTAAYLTGTWFGAHYVCPTISPKKSWEGLCAGFIAVMVLINFLKHKRIDLYEIFQIKNLLQATILTAAAFLGDLFESYLKRRAGVKDAANLLPGHGGLLDRIDAVFGVTLVFWLFW